VGRVLSGAPLPPLTGRVSGAWARVVAWLDESDPGDGCRPIPRERAVSWMLLLYVAGFGLATYAAVAYLVDPATLPPAPGTLEKAVRGALRDLLESLAIVLAAVVSIRHVAGGWAPIAGSTRWGTRWRTELVAGAASLCVMLVGFALGGLIGADMSYPRSQGRWDAIGSIAGSLTAGPTEELVVLAAPVVLMRAARISWAWVFAALVVLRISFHLYYGWSSVGLIVWAAGVAAIYVRSRAVIGLVVAHSLWDVFSSVADYASPLAVDLLATGSAVPITAVIVLQLRLELTRFREARRRRVSA
jgi:hypothetical protein